MDVRLGDDRHGFEIKYVALSHPHWGFPVSDDLTVRAYGLPAGHSLFLRALMAFNGTAMISYLQLHVEGLTEIRAVVDAFEGEFNPNK